MNPESMLSERIRLERREFFQNMKAQGINDETFLSWFWNHKYNNCKSAVLITAAAMYEGWKGCSEFA